MIKSLIFAVGLLLMTAVGSHAEITSRIAAVVNDEIITTFQLEKELQKEISRQMAEEELSSEEREALRKKVLDLMIEESLVQQRVEELRLQVSDDEVEQAIVDVERQNRLSRQQLVAALAQEGLEFSDYRENLRKQILRFKLLGREVNAMVDVTIPEIEEYYRQHIEDYRGKPFVRLSRLSLYFSSETSTVQKATLYDRALKVREQLLSGHDLDSVLIEAKKEGPIDGGDMGSFGDGELIPRFAEAVKELEVGGVTEVLETESGYHVLILTDRSPGEVEIFESKRPEIEGILKQKKTEERFKEWSQGLKEKAFIDIRL